MLLFDEMLIYQIMMLESLSDTISKIFELIFTHRRSKFRSDACGHIDAQDQTMVT